MKIFKKRIFFQFFCYKKDHAYRSNLQGGATGGTCAGGFGVCCYFIASCGQTYSQNLTYWTKTSTTPCNIKVCKCQADVCFLRLDFNSFNLYQPNTDTTAANPTLASQCIQVRVTDYSTQVTMSSSGCSHREQPRGRPRAPSVWHQQ